MQFKFLTALLLLGACFIQTSTAYPQNTEVDKGIIDDLIDQANKAIDALQKFLSDIIKKALDVFNNLKDEVSQISNGAIEEAKKKLQEIFEGVLKKIDEIKKKAEELGVDISKCIDDNEQRISDLYDRVIKDEINCVQKEVDEANRIITEGVDIVDGILETVDSLPEKLKQCGSGLSSITCIKNVIVEAVKLQANLPLEVAQKVKEVTEFVALLKVRVLACASSQLTQAVAEAGQIVADVAQCAAEVEGQYRNM